MDQQPTNGPEVAKTAPSKLPVAWPGAFGLLKHSKEVVRENLGTIIGLVALSILVSVVAGSFGNGQELTTVYMLAQLVSSVASIFLTIAITLALLAGIDNQKMSVGDSLSKSAPLFVNYFLMSIALGAITVLSLLALIVPFFFVFPRLMLAEYFLVDKKMGPIESIKASWEATKGNVGKVWGIIGANLAFALLIITLIGIPVAIYLLFMYMAALPILYRWFLRNQVATGPVASSAPVNSSGEGPVVRQ